MTTPATPGRATLLWRGATRACPACGQRHLTRRWVVLCERCPNCNFMFERAPGHFVGAVGMNTIVTFGLMLLSIVLGFVLTLPDPAFWPIMLVAVGIAVLVPPLFHVTSKTLWCSVDLMMNPLEDSDCDPDIEPLHRGRNAKVGRAG